MIVAHSSHGSGPAVLLSHGYSATAEMWNGQLDALGGYQVITWDMRGHGRSESPVSLDEYSEAHTVADMVGILDSYGVERAVIGGLSLGGYMSLGFYAAHPERTAALMLFDTGPGYRNDEGREGWNVYAIQQAERFEERGLDALGRSAEVKVSTHQSAAGLALAARGMLTQKDDHVMATLPKVSVPCLVLVGELDKPFLGATDYMAAKIPGSRKVVIPGAGHAANIDQPEAFNRAVREFLDSITW